MIALAAADYRAALPAGGRLLGLDVGTKTIGTALCDAGWSFASPAVPATKHAAPDLRLSSGKMDVSMTYHAPRQKLATPMPTAIWSGSLLHGWSSTVRSSMAPISVDG